MMLKNLETKYITVMIFDFGGGLFPAPQITDILSAKSQYGEKEVILSTNDDERKMTVIELA